jgi:hypothetical protein
MSSNHGYRSSSTTCEPLALVIYSNSHRNVEKQSGTSSHDTTPTTSSMLIVKMSTHDVKDLAIALTKDHLRHTR